MFAKLFGKQNPARREPDKIWQTRQLQYLGLLAFLESLNRQTTRVLLIAHFPETFRALSGLLATQSIPHQTYTTASEGFQLQELAAYQPVGRILLALAAALPDALTAPPRPTAAGDFTINVLVAAHHPLSSFDDRIPAFAASLPCPSTVCFHEALDGPLLRAYGGEQIARLMTSLGIPDTEFIANPTIDRSIRTAQEKIARQVPNPVTTDSAEQWFQLHLPQRN